MRCCIVLVAFVFALGSAITPRVAGAEGGLDYLHTGPYLGAGGVAQIFTGTWTNETRGYGGGLVGYRFGRAFGADLEVLVGSRSIVKVVGQAKIYPVGNWPVQPYLLVGLGTMIFPDSAGAVGLVRPGVGVDLYASEHWVVAPTVYYEAIFNSRSIASLDAVNFGATLQYRF